jgi:hypothetical protein
MVCHEFPTSTIRNCRIAHVRDVRFRPGSKAGADSERQHDHSSSAHKFLPERLCHGRESHHDPRVRLLCTSFLQDRRILRVT